MAPNRSSESWQKNVEQLQLNQFIAKALDRSRGKGITSGYEAVYPQLPWYSDHFHEFRGLFKLLNKFEKIAVAAIEYEHDRQCKFDNARSKSNLEKRLEQYEQAIQKCSQCIDLYEQFKELLSMLIPSLYFFNESVQPNDRQTVKDDILTIASHFKEVSIQEYKVSLYKSKFDKQLSYKETLYSG